MFMIGYTVEEPPDSSAETSPDSFPLSVLSVFSMLSVDSPSELLPSELPPSPLEQPAMAAAPVTPVAAMNLRRETRSDSISESCVIT
ncbi:hypothetical protein GCM10009030_29870 [Haloarcula pellucida]|uniref:Uncharacterized protein n=1 Tax=Haloarcula pellucida TaxID=1427151 RepID=A0A830GMS0_9EURY|nr:hypothetical protein GCM10009030_29870 [Halomicroarcula pellucida]